MLTRLRKRLRQVIDLGREAIFWHRLGRGEPLADRSPGRIRFAGCSIRYTDRASFYVEYKDIFRQRIYHFDSDSRCPRILDGGGCIGMSVLYFKKQFPHARVTTFEPDPAMAAILRENLQLNGIEDVEIIEAGLADRVGTLRFAADGSDAGRIIPGAATRAEKGKGTTLVRTVCLSRYLDEPVDFLKLNIEGQELPVLLESMDKLRNVREMVIEYHGWAGGEQRLGHVLNLLDRKGFRYLVHDFDAVSCGGTKPPFRYRPAGNWQCLIHARRIDEMAVGLTAPRLAA